MIRRLPRAKQVWCLTEKYIPLALLYAHLKKSKLIILIHGTYATLPFQKINYRAWLYRMAYKKATRIIAVSQYTKDQLLKFVSISPEKITVSGLGVDIDTSINFPGFDQRENAIISIGAVKPRKGIHLVIEALNNLKLVVDGLKYYVVGDLSNSGYVMELEKKINIYCLDNIVEFKGHLSEDEKIELIDKSKVLAMPSLNHKFHYEGFGLVHLEANARGLPTIGSLGCGNQSAVKDGYSGFLVRQHHIMNLTEKIRILITNKSEWARFSENALQWAKKNTWNKVTSKLHLLSNHGG